MTARFFQAILLLSSMVHHLAAGELKELFIVPIFSNHNNILKERQQDILLHASLMVYIKLETCLFAYCPGHHVCISFHFFLLLWNAYNICIIMACFTCCYVFGTTRVINWDNDLGQ
ncbi:hypothetical protein ACJX0J_017988, partial [Zea mays]